MTLLAQGGRQSPKLAECQIGTAMAQMAKLQIEIGASSSDAVAIQGTTRER
jgi:hypothetical protein